MDIEVEFSLEVVGAELAETEQSSNKQVSGPFPGSRRGLARDTYCASSQVTMLDRPMRYIRVKKARIVKIRGARRNSYWSRWDTIDCSVYVIAAPSANIVPEQSTGASFKDKSSTFLEESLPSSAAPSSDLHYHGGGLQCRWARRLVLVSS